MTVNIDVGAMDYKQLQELKETMLAASRALTAVVTQSDSLPAVEVLHELHKCVVMVGTSALDEIDKRYDGARQLIESGDAP